MIVPAPEEVRTWAEYVQLVRAANSEDDAQYLLKKHTYPVGTLKQYFEHCWQMPEAEMLHAAWSNLGLNG